MVVRHHVRRVERGLFAEQVRTRCIVSVRQLWVPARLVRRAVASVVAGIEFFPDGAGLTSTATALVLSSPFQGAHAERFGEKV